MKYNVCSCTYHSHCWAHSSVQSMGYYSDKKLLCRHRDRIPVSGRVRLRKDQVLKMNKKCLCLYLKNLF